MSGRCDLPIPNGWFAIAWSKDVAPGEVIKTHYFEQDLVVFRTESGKVNVLDAYCPHLGAHLGVGGTVVGESLQCPFHAWRWNAEGSCVGIPYAKRIPPGAKMRSWRVQELAGLILVWHHAEDAPPFFELPEMTEFDDPDWSEPDHFEMTIGAHVQDTNENNCDPVHFKYVHESDNVPASEISYQGLVMHMESESDYESEFGTFTTRLVRDAFGIGLVAVRIVGIPECGLLMFSSTSPITREKSCSRWVFMTTKNLYDTAGKEFISKFQEGVTQDFPIWENKIHRRDPLLCEEDDMLAEYRRWASNFYGSGPNGAHLRRADAGGE
ncbi:MAG: Rieske 2Fe-2S domain-containing protein [Candidatus Binatia bacterium]